MVLVASQKFYMYRIVRILNTLQFQRKDLEKKNLALTAALNTRVINYRLPEWAYEREREREREREITHICARL